METRSPTVPRFVGHSAAIGAKLLARARSHLRPPRLVQALSLALGGLRSHVVGAHGGPSEQVQPAQCPTDSTAATTPDYDPPAPDDLVWSEEPEFSRLFAAGGEVFGNAPKARYYVLKELLLSIGRLDHDTAEIGVYRGFSSHVIRYYSNQVATPGVRHHLFDSFQGLSEPAAEDAAPPGIRPWRKGDMAAGLELVQRNLSEHDGLVFHPGWIPSCFAGADDLRFSFVHIDVDLYEPTLASLDYVLPRLVPGGLVVFDDYGFVSCPGARRAVDEAVARRGLRVVRLTSGQAFLRAP